MIELNVCISFSSGSVNKKEENRFLLGIKLKNRNNQLESSYLIIFCSITLFSMSKSLLSKESKDKLIAYYLCRHSIVISCLDTLPTRWISNKSWFYYYHHYNYCSYLIISCYIDRTLMSFCINKSITCQFFCCCCFCCWDQLSVLLGFIIYSYFLVCKSRTLQLACYLRSEIFRLQKKVPGKSAFIAVHFFPVSCGQFQF